MNADLRDYQRRILTSDPKNTGFKVGDTVEWVNDYGVKWTHKVIGFNYSMEYNKRYSRFVHLDNDSYWFPHNHEHLKKVN